MEETQEQQQQTTRYRPKKGSTSKSPVTAAGGTGNNIHTSALEVYARIVDDFRRLPNAAESFARMIALEPDPTLQTHLRHMSDRAAFAREALQFEPESDLQEQALRTNGRRLILNCNRQWGKSTISAIRALHRAWFWPNSLVLIVSQAHPQAGELLHKIRGFLSFLATSIKGDGINRLSIRLPNGSRIVALPGGEKPTRSYSSVALVIIDEAAMVPDPVQDAVAPTLARLDGDLMLISTPRGKRGAFYRAWAYGGDDEWERIFGPVTTSAGRIPAAHLESERRRGGEDFFAQEYMCEFLDRDSHLFNEDTLREVFAQDIDTWETKGK